MSLPPFTFNHPSNVMLAGPSGSGKTRFLVRALELGMFCPRPTRVVWVYGEDQADHDTLNELTAIGKLPKVEFLKNDTSYQEIVEGFDRSQVNLLVLDDQMKEAKTNPKEFDNIFTKGSHHRNITVVLLLQNVFEDGFRTVNINMRYLVVFKNPRDQRQITVLGSQMFPSQSDFITKVYEDATAREPFTYLVFDVHGETRKELRILTNVLSTKRARVYVPAGYPELGSVYKDDSDYEALYD